MNTRRTLILLAVMALALALAAPNTIRLAAQAPTSTPQPVNLATRPPDGVQIQTSPTPSTTPEGQIFIEAREFANVRAQPDTGAAQLGQIAAGERHVAIGRYFEWIQFEYESSPTGWGWVFGDLVDVIGDVTQIPELTDPAAIAPDQAELDALNTQVAITQTPGGLLTATAVTRFEQLGQATLDGPNVLPTFTYPPGIVFVPTQSAPLPDATAEPQATVSAAGGSLPPLAPILIVGGLGVLGLILNSLRRRG